MSIVVAKAWLYATLTGDATLTALLGAATAIYDRKAGVPQGAPTPHIVYELTMAEDVLGVAGEAIMVHSDATVLAVGADGPRGQLSYTALRAIAARIQTLLHRAAPTTNAHGTMSSCVREMPLEDSEPGPGENLTPYAGGVYRITSY